MKEKIKALFPIWKWARVQMLVIIILTAVICLTIPREYQMVREMQKEASQVWSEHIERIENTKDNGEPVESSAKTESQVEPIKAKAEDLSSAPASGIEEKILDKFGEDGKIALAIAKAESGLVSKRSNQMNSNRTYDWGIMQVNDCHCKNIDGDCHEKLLDPDFNIEFSYGIYERSGKTFGPWSTYTSKKYLAYL